MAKIQQLPTDVQFLIVDYLCIDDCYALQETNKTFFDELVVGDSFWAKKLFEKHIQYLNKSLNMFKFSEASVPYYVPTTLEFSNFKGAKALWDELIQNQSKLNNAFRFVGLENNGVQLFTQRIYTILANPTAPLPSLKRENHYIPTSSCFENFLTEIHFDIYPKARPQDIDHIFLEEMCSFVQSKLLKASKRKNLIIQSNRALRRAEKKEQNTSKISRKNRVETVLQRINQEKFERIFAKVQNVIKSHCQIIRNYLLCLAGDRIVLKEYKRCWKEFTYSMIEMNSLLKPYESLFNANANNKDYLTIWKTMVQIWLDEVYSMVALKVKTSFQKLLMGTIVQEITETNLTINQKKKLLSGTNNFDQIEKDQEMIRDREKVVNLLLKSFIALSDISLYKSDFSTSGSIDLSQFQPKLKLVSFVYPKIRSFIETAIVTLNEEPHKLKEALNTVKSVIDTVFNDEISLERISDKCFHQEEEEQGNFREIAGQYQIISRCKWNTRLSEIYQSMSDEIVVIC